MSILEFIKEHGLVVEELIMDGTIHRVPVEGGRPGSKDGSYCFYDDEKGIAGWIQNYRTGVYATHGEGRRTNKLSHPVKLASNINNSRQALYDKAAETARYLVTEIFKPAPASNHYLARKRISAHGSLIDKAGILIIPLKNINGNIRTFQRILDNGEKYFLKGAEQTGCFHSFGKFKNTVIICEGFATGASIYEACRVYTVSAMSKSNLKNVALAFRERYGESLKIIIAGDNDLTAKENYGKIFAEKAAEVVNGTLLLPKFTKDEILLGYTDFNDLALNKKSLYKILKDVL